ncbi:DUF3108 domain-containing protein [Pseudemcibacter aquimaris]|uniref:DUF3108 domain-containing protein n=1 Tax=Pseudemcibacter aquimaris TaxID=2857064 RepID=UPI002011A551|nr:DUF3108 domain-containing protein [Pseudemcibacter aquimaris]MCC3859792.1 DUF3108 domain-containing protein [Pseudemcibacter aquimaris]WDU60186.1 DUF3108 domain-containing protein [Pseudemcibacter aquimaris]
MKILIRTILILFTFSAYANAQIGSSYKVNLKYKAYWGGFTVAEITSDTIIDNNNYEVSAHYKVKGIASIVGKMENNTMARGIMHRTGEYRQLYYQSQGNFGKFKYLNKVSFNPDNLMVTDHVQELELRENTEYIPIDDLDKHGFDPMTLFLNMIMNENFNRDYKNGYRDRQFGGVFVSSQSFLCDEYETLEKERRSVFEGETTICKIDGELLAGGIRSTDPKKERKRGREDDDQDSRLWFGKMPGFNGMLPVYTEFKIGWGKVRIYLSDFSIEPIEGNILTAENNRD